MRRLVLLCCRHEALPCPEAPFTNKVSFARCEQLLRKDIPLKYCFLFAVIDYYEAVGWRIV